jgi:hypothetical protein
MSIALVAALGTVPLRVSARTCIVYNTPEEKACHMDCCANKTCCATSPKNTAPTSQPLAKSATSHELSATLMPTVAVISPSLSNYQQSVPLACACSALSPPRLAVLCTFLI